jgi:hypothetical protein
MKECLACERLYDESLEVMDGSIEFQSETYCSPECKLIYEAALKESSESAKIKGLIDDEGNSILGGSYQQAVQRAIKEASKIGIKISTEKE